MSADTNAVIGRLKTEGIDNHSKKVIGGAERALADRDNPLRLNFFATAMRMLFEHMIDVLSPDADVKNCSWFKSERPNGSPTRAQRIKFAVQGGSQMSS